MLFCSIHGVPDGVQPIDLRRPSVVERIDHDDIRGRSTRSGSIGANEGGEDALEVDVEVAHSEDGWCGYFCSSLTRHSSRV